MYAEGAKWDCSLMELAESDPKVWTAEALGQGRDAAGKAGFMPLLGH